MRQLMGRRSALRLLSEIQMSEDLADDRPHFDEGNDFHPTSAATTNQWVHLVNLLQESGPVAAALAGVVPGERVRLHGAVAGGRPGRRETLTLLTSLAARGVGIAAVVTDPIRWWESGMWEVTRAIQFRASRERGTPSLVRYWIRPVSDWCMPA